MIPSLVGRAFLLGIATGPFCVGFCVPLIGPLLLGQDRTGIRQSAGSVALFLLGRLVAYLLFGLVFGLLGSVLHPVWSVKAILLPVLYAVLGVLMVLYGAVSAFPHIGFCRALNPGFQSRWYLLAIGFLAGINLCPPFLLAVTSAFGLAGALPGALFFLVFFVATSLYLIPLFFLGALNRFPVVRIAGRIAAVAAGFYFIFLGVRSLV